MINGIPAGPHLFMFLLVQTAIFDTWATSSMMRENLSNLDSYMSTVKSDVEKFNQYVNYIKLKKMEHRERKKEA